MAEADTWPSIQRRGLLSTTALLDLFEVEPHLRPQFEACHRPESVRIEHPSLGSAVLRDQKPMDDRGLGRALAGSGITPIEWYKLLNGRVFFWLTRDRLLTLLNARAYKEKTHTVLTVRTAPVIEKYAHQIELSPINSGCTKPFPHPRNARTFLPIDQYPFSAKKLAGMRSSVVELTIPYSVPDIASYVERVDAMRGSSVMHEIYQAG